jgi:hypothetical protein
MEDGWHWRPSKCSPEKPNQEDTHTYMHMDHVFVQTNPDAHTYVCTQHIHKYASTIVGLGRLANPNCMGKSAGWTLREGLPRISSCSGKPVLVEGLPTD